MKVFVTGVCGQLGHDVMNELINRGHNCIGSDVSPGYMGILDDGAVCNAPYIALDITDQAMVRRIIDGIGPDAVIHCAAWTDVDAAEKTENAQKVHAVNVDGTYNIAAACRDTGCKLMFISTDYVFDGKGTTPWPPDCDSYHPLNAYGRSKLEAEKAVMGLMEKYFIVRTAWAFGMNGKNFIKTMLKIGQTHDTLQVVDDQVGTPTYTYDLSRLLVDLIETEKYGIYHATNEGGYVSWAGFAREIFRQADMDVRVVPVTTAEYKSSWALRPFNSRLDKSKLVECGFEPLPDWKDAVRRYLVELNIRKK